MAAPCTNGTTPAPLTTITCTEGTTILGVTPGTSQLTITVDGAGGGAGNSMGGNGAEVAGTVTLPPGTAFLAVTAGEGGQPGDFFGLSGPTGGGGSAVVALDAGQAVLAKLAIAGAGGAGGGGDASPAGAGGNAGIAGGTADATVGAGGQPGFGPTGGAPGAGGNDFGQSQAGASDTPGSYLPAAGGGGGSGIGGAVPSQGGGGGGGYAGGGGGGAGNNDLSVAGGGGGGSSFASPIYGAGLGIGVAAGSGGTVGNQGRPGVVVITMGSATGPPSAPATVTATPGNTQASVTFSVPASDGGATISGYTITSAPGGIQKSCTVSPCTVTGLTNGTAYTFTVTATNPFGTSDPGGPSNSVTPATVPNPPTAVTATGSDASASVSFTPPIINGGSAVTSYTATSAPGGFTGACPASPCTVAGLTNGTAYTFTVVATNAVGNSAPSASSASATPVGAPDAPVLTAAAGDAQIAVSFPAPVDGGSAITGYEISLDGGDTWNPLPTTADGVNRVHTVTGLINGTTYQVVVRAHNAAATGDPSNTVTVTPARVPDRPTGASAVAGEGQASVSFTAPAGDGGSAITSYTVTSAPGGLTATCPASPCTVTGLNNGTAYTFTVAATNAIGDSLPSSPSAAVTPATVPSAPVVTATAGDGQITVMFPAPNNGGSAIIRYEISVDNGDTYTTMSTSTLGADLVGVRTGLVNGTTYPVKVRAVNIVGDGAGSDSQNVVPGTVPDPPTGVAATAGQADASIAFTPPVNDGGSPITGYTVTSAPGAISVDCPGSPCMIEGLTHGTYTFTVVATNAVGDSDPSGASNAVTPVDVPGAVLFLAVTHATPTSLTVSFALADDGGSEITGYEISVDGGTIWHPLAATGTDIRFGTFSGLAPSTTYPLKVRAINALGTGPNSEAVNGRTLPAAVPAPTAVAGTASVKVSWTASADLGVTGYTVTAHPGPATCESTLATSCIIGATAGVAYTYTVVAHTANGDSGASAASDPVTAGAPLVPATVPLNAATTLTTTDGVLTTVSPGQQITVLGSGFLAYSSVAIILYSSPVVLARPVTDRFGNFVQPVTIPLDIQPGTHNLVASGVDPNGNIHQIRMEVTAADNTAPAVVNPPVTPTDITGPTGGAPLPFTGAPIEQLALWATIATGLGVWLTLSSRRRRGFPRR